MLSPEGVGLALRGQQYALRATPAATTVPTVWLLGSSDYSARLAASMGLPYVFAHHFSGSGTEQALALYRDGFTASDLSGEGAGPQTFLTANVVVAETPAEAERLALPQLQSMVALRTGGTLTAQRAVEDAELVELPPAHEDLLSAMRERWLVGTPETVAERLADLAGRHGVDEVMVNPVAASHRGADPASALEREETLRLLAKVVDPS